MTKDLKTYSRQKFIFLLALFLFQTALLVFWIESWFCIMAMAFRMGLRWDISESFMCVFSSQTVEKKFKSFCKILFIFILHANNYRKNDYLGLIMPANCGKQFDLKNLKLFRRLRITKTRHEDLDMW